MGAGEAAEEEGNAICLSFPSPLLPRVHGSTPPSPPAPARTTMMNATVITSYFFLGLSLSLHFALSEDGFTTAPSSVPSSARSFVPPFFNWEYFVGLVLAAAAAAGSN